MNSEEKPALARKLQQFDVKVTIGCGALLVPPAHSHLPRDFPQFTRLADRKKHVYEQDLLSMLFAQRASMTQPQDVQEMRTS